MDLFQALKMADKPARRGRRRVDEAHAVAAGCRVRRAGVPAQMWAGSTHTSAQDTFPREEQEW